MGFDIHKHTILRVVHGSKAYGTATEESDTDYKGVAVPPARYFCGFASNFEQHETSDPDETIYDIRKFFRLASGCNPNIIEVLLCPDDCVVMQSDEGRMLRDEADRFLSRRAIRTFGGYARAQLKKLRVRTRNGKRAELEKRYGYDTKAAMHVVRLMRMCHELLSEGVVRVRRPDADELLAIRRGAWTLEEVESWAASQLGRIGSLRGTTDLPPEPDMDALDGLCMALVRSCLAKAGRSG